MPLKREQVSRAGNLHYAKEVGEMTFADGALSHCGVKFWSPDFKPRFPRCVLESTADPVPGTNTNRPPHVRTATLRTRVGRHHRLSPPQ